MEPIVQRIYSIKIEGYDSSLKSLKTLTSAFEKMDAAKKKANDLLGKATKAGDSVAVERLTAKIKELEKALKDLDRQRQKTEKENELLSKKSEIQEQKLQQEKLKTQKLKNQESEQTQRQARAEQKVIDDLSSDYKQLSLAYRDAALRAKNMALVMGENHPLAVQASKDAAAMHDQLLRLDKGTGDSRRNVGNYGQALHSLSQVLREAPAFANSAQTGFMAIGNNLPMLTDEFKKLSAQIDVTTGKKLGFTGALKVMLGGLFSWQTLLIAILTILPGIASGMGTWIGNLFKSKDAIDKAKESAKSYQEALASIREESIKDSTKDVVKLELLRKILTDLTRSQKQRSDALKEYNSIADDANKVDVVQLNNINLINDKISTQIGLIKDRALARASENIVVKRSEELLLAQEKAKTEIQEVIDIERKTNKRLIINDRDGKKTPDFVIQYELAGEINKRVANDPAVKDAQEKLDQALKAAFKLTNGNFATKEPTKDKEAQASKLSVQERDDLKRIEAIRDAALTRENLRVSKIRELRELTLEEERQHIEAVRKIHDESDRKKIVSIKGTNAEELRLRSALELDISQRKIEADKQVQALNQKEFEKEAAILKKALGNKISGANLGVSLVEIDPRTTNEQRAQSKKDADEKIILLTGEYYDHLEDLAAKYNVNISALEEEKEKASTDLVIKSLNNKRLLAQAGIDDIKKEGERRVREISINFSKERQKILDNDKISADKKKKQLEILDRAEKRTILSAELETLTKEVAKKKQQLDASLISNDEYLEAVKNQQKKAEELSQFTSDTSFSSIAAALPKPGGANDLIKSLLKGKISVGKNSEGKDVDGSELLGNILAESYSLAQQAMQNYFDAERQRVEESKKIAYERIEIEKQQLLAQAQSQQEKDSIEKRAQALKEKADREAGEKLKKIKKSEAKIALGVELANIAVAAAQNPLNGLTFGAAGIAMYAILAGLAFARYANNVKNIDTQQFAGGGKVQRQRPGRITMAPNIPTQPNGDNILATLKVGEVVLNEEQQRLLGGSRAFSRVGVPGFATGGKVQPFLGGFSFGESLQAPINPQSFLNGNNSSADFSDLKSMVQEITTSVNNVSESVISVNRRIDNLKVQVVAKEVDNVNNNVKKADAIGNI
jgi:hypothetical protein